MRSTWKRAFATLLTIAMLASLLVVPAAAADVGSNTAGEWKYEVPTEPGTYTESHNFTTDGDEDTEGFFAFYFKGNDGTKGTEETGIAYNDGKNDLTLTDYYPFSDSGSRIWFIAPADGVLTIISKKTLADKDPKYKNQADTKRFSADGYDAKDFPAGDADAALVEGKGYYQSTVNLTKGSYGFGRNNNGGIYYISFTYEIKDASALNVELERKSATVMKGGTVTLTPTVTPEGTAVDWKSSDETVATVEAGVVTGVKAGTATITATVGTGEEAVSATCAVSVVEPLDGVLHIFDNGATLPKAPEGSDIRVGSGASATANDNGYVLDASNAGIASQSGGSFKGTTLSRTAKFSSGGRLFKFVAPGAGTLAVYFATTTADGAKMNYAVDGGTATGETSVSAAAPYTVETVAGSEYTISRGASGNSYPAYMIWTASDYACEHEWSETAVTVDDAEVYYCTNPVCLETKPAEEGGDKVAEDAVAAIVAAIGGDATATAANFEASKGSLDTSDEDALNRFVVDALIAKMGATYAQQVEFEVTKAEYTDLSAATSLLADGEVKVGEIAYEVTVLAKDDNSDTADIKGTIDVMAAEGGDEPDPGKTYIAAGTYNFVKSAATPADTAIENAGGALTWTDVSYQNNSNNDMHGPKATAGTSAVKVATDPDKYTTLILTGCQYGTKTAPTATGATIEAVGTAGSDPVYYVFNAQGDVTFTLHAGDFIHSIEALVIDTPVTLYTVGAAKVDNGTVTVSPAGKVPAGTEITVTTSAASGYELDESSLKYGATAITGGKFTMPAENTEVTATFESADIGEVAAGTYNYLDDWQTAPKAAGFEWGAGMTRPASKDHGVKAETGNGPATLKLHLTDTATVYVELCGYNNSSVVSDQIVGGTTVTGATDSTWTVLKNDGNPPSSYALKFVNVTADTDGVATLTFSNNTFIHAVKVVYEETVVKTDLAEKTVTLKKGETALGDTAPVVDDVLTASVADVDAADVEFIWTVGGTPQTGKGATYTVKAADMGKTISVKAAAPAASTKYTGETAAVTTADVKGKTMTVTVTPVSKKYNGEAAAITVAVKDAAGNTVATPTLEYQVGDGAFSATKPSIVNVADSANVTVKATKEGYEPATSEATAITITQADAPSLVIKANLSKIAYTGGTVNFTITGVPEGSTVKPTATCTEKPTNVIQFTKQTNGSYTGSNTIDPTDGESEHTHTVTVTWSDPNYAAITPPTCTITQLTADAVVPVAAEDLTVWAGKDYAALGVSAEVDKQANMLTIAIDEAKILAAYDADATAFQGDGIMHGADAYMMVHFNAPENFDVDNWTVQQTVNGTAGAKWKLDGTDSANELDYWTEGDAAFIGDWFGILKGVSGATQSMPDKNTYEMQYDFYDGDTLKATIVYNVDRQVIEAATVALTANADLDDVTVPEKISPEEDFELTVAVKDGVDKVLPETITVAKNGAEMADTDYTWDKTTGKVTIPAAKIAAKDAIVITVAPAAKPADKTELNAAITAATTKMAGVETSADGKDIAKDKTWVTTAVMNDLNEKLTAAQTVADKTNATQTEVDEAKAALVAATTAFAPAAGLKDEGGENPPAENVKVLNIADEVAAGRITVTGDANTAIETDTTGLGTDGFFTIMPKSSNGLIEPGKNVDFGDGYTGTVAYKTGGGMTVAEGDTGRLVKFTTTAESTVKVWWTSASAGCLLNLKDATGADLFKEEGEGHPSSGADSIVVTVIENVPADTECYLGGTKGVRFYKIEVSPAVGGGVTVDKTALTAALAAAKAIDTTAVKTSADGADVPTTEKWVTPAVKDALTKAIADAEKLGENATQTEVNAAAKALTDAVAAWNPADGTKTEGGEPTTPADKTALNAAIEAAKGVYAIGNDVKVMPAGTKTSAVDKGQKFVTQDVYDALAKAIADAEAVAADENATEEDIAKAVDALNKAKADMKVLTGTKSNGNGGGSSSSNRGSGSSSNGTTTTTVTNPDGSKVTTEKKTDGSVTVTTTNPDGEVIAQVSVPATIPSVGYKFVDVPNDHWAAKSINDMAGLGMVQGVDNVNHIFDMNSNITRGSVAAILFRFANGKTGMSQNFTDVAEGLWFTDAVAWASNAGVVNGFEDGSFRPDGNITREQLAVMIARFAKIIGLDTSATGSLVNFRDSAKVQAWAVDGVTWCVANGIINGRGDGIIDPSAPATRAEATAMLDRFIQLLK